MQNSNSSKPVFCFLDESGTIGGNNCRYFALGAIVHPSPDELIEALHSAFEGLVADCKRERTAQEFHFTDLTKGTLMHFENAIACLERDKHWRFFSVILDLHDPLFQKPVNAISAWACYLRWIKIMLQRNLKPDEKTTLIADFFKRPKANVHSLATMPSVVPQLWDVLQVESQGVLLVQMTDVLLGASLYSGISEAKIALADKVKKLKTKVGKARFNEWRIRWDK